MPSVLRCRRSNSRSRQVSTTLSPHLSAEAKHSAAQAGQRPIRAASAWKLTLCGTIILANRDLYLAALKYNRGYTSADVTATGAGTTAAAGATALAAALIAAGGAVENVTREF